MSPHQFLDDDLRDRAAQFALGCLDEREARLERLHLVDCAPCRTEVEAISALTREAVLAGPLRQPPEGTWSRVLERIRAKGGTSGRRSSPVARALSPTPEGTSTAFAFVSAGEGAWVPTGVAGVDVRHLHADPSTDRMTFLVRMAPGSSYPGTATPARRSATCSRAI